MTPKPPCRSTVVRARRACDGHELWRTAPLPRPQGPLLTGDGRVHLAAAGGGALALSTKDGTRAAAAPTATCFALLRHPSSVLCWGLEHAGVRELDGRALALRRTVAADVRPTLPGPVVGADGVLVVPAGNEDASHPVDRFLTAYDWRTGRRPWHYGAPQETAGLVPAGKRVLSFGAYALEGRNTSGDVDTLRRKDTPRTRSGTGATAVHLGRPLCPGARCSPTPTRTRSSPAMPREPIRSPPDRAYRWQPRDTRALATPCAVVAGARWPYRRR
ncbi:hypothetical protein [Streptomyces sp. NBC_00063]|uniref:hypothetical protein n=1 Tax=Streptomyces sp. NBC_00063 TaxID=2975638 RepID=UPI003D74D19A